MAMQEKKRATRTQTITITRRITLEEKHCPQCRKKFFGRKNQTFCSRPCVQKESYERHADARRAHRREVYHEQKSHAATGAR